MPREPHPADDISAVRALLPVSDTVAARLTRYAELLVQWQKAKNLVAPSTLPELWRRHIADSAQIVPLLGEARRIVDLGSGAGFPGLVIAAFLADHIGDGGVRPEVHLIEANGRKAQFLRTVARECGLPAIIHAERIEAAIGTISGPVDAVTARALAPLGDLLTLAQPLMAAGTVAVFHKGRDFAHEKQIADADWTLDLVEVESRTDPDAVLVRIRTAAPRSVPR